MVASADDAGNLALAPAMPEARTLAVDASDSGETGSGAVAIPAAGAAEETARIAAGEGDNGCACRRLANAAGKGIDAAQNLAGTLVTVLNDNAPVSDHAPPTTNDACLTPAVLDVMAPVTAVALTIAGNLLEIAEGLPFAKPVVAAIKIILEAVKAVRANMHV